MFTVFFFEYVKTKIFLKVLDIYIYMLYNIYSNKECLESEVFSMANLMVLATDNKWHTFIKYDGRIWVDGYFGYTQETGNEEFCKLNAKKAIKLDTLI